jgi:hypothetical protein
MTRKQLILFWTDAALFVLFGALAATGIIIHWVLPPGSGGRGGGRGGGHQAAELLNLSRHDWGQIHFWIAALMLCGVLLHFAMHWGWIKTSVRRLFRGARTV